MASLDKAWIHVTAEVLHEVAMTPERAERLAALVERFNRTALEQAHRLALEDEPVRFLQVLQRHKDVDEGP